MNKTIHFFWTARPGSAADIPTDVEKTLGAWRTTHPDFDQKVWNEEKTIELCRSHGRIDVVSAIEASLYPAMKSDLARLALMFFEGGVYSDLKNFPTATFLGEYLALGKPVVTQHPPTIPNYERFICNAFFCGEAGHTFFEELLNLVTANVAGRTSQDIHGATGGGPLMKVLGRPFRDDVIVKLTEDVWGDPKVGNLMKRVSASYNGANNADHWSKKQHETGLYVTNRS